MLNTPGKTGGVFMKVVLACLAVLVSAPAMAYDTPYLDYLEQQNLKKAARAAQSANRYAAHKALCAKVGGARVGLNAEGVLKSCWGKPDKINETATAEHTHEQWIYATGDYLYLTDGIVTSIQTHR